MSWQEELGELPILRLPEASEALLELAEKAYRELDGLPRVARAWGWLSRLEELEPRLCEQREAQGGARVVRRLMALEGLLTGLSLGLSFVRLALALGPESEQRDEAGRLHCLTGPARGSEYWVCGEQVDPAWVLAPGRKTLQDLTRLRSAEARRALLKRMGPRRALETGWASVLDLDRDFAGGPRRLLALDVGDSEPLVVVEVTDATSQALHYLRVPPTVRSCAEGVAWTFGFSIGGYRPLAEA